MTSLSRVAGLQPDLSIFLSEAGVRTSEDLAAADPVQLQQELSRIARQRGRGSAIPSLVTVKLWVQSAQQAVVAARNIALDDIPEAIALEDIPEAEIDFDEIPEAEPAPAPQPVAPRVQTTAPAVALENKPLGPVDQDGHWLGMDRKRLQNLDDYAANERGIRPLRRSANSASPSPAKVKADAQGTTSRRTRKGVLYPFPLRVILGALISLLWRFGLIATCVLLPWIILTQPEGAERPVSLILTWVGVLLLVGCMQLWIASSVRCRVCSCHLFVSKRCFKNSRAHLITGLGYVVSLALHALLFQWFRCMYCGTAIRLFGGKSRSTPVAIVQD